MKEDGEMKESWNRMMGFRAGREVSCSPFVLLGEKDRGTYEDREMFERMGTLAVWVGWKLEELKMDTKQGKAGLGKARRPTIRGNCACKTKRHALMDGIAKKQTILVLPRAKLAKSERGRDCHYYVGRQTQTMRDDWTESGAIGKGWWW